MTAVPRGQLKATLEAHAKTLNARTDQALRIAATLGARVLRARVPVDTGEMRRHVLVREVGPTPKSGSARVVELVVDSPYAIFQEAGTGPFWPPLAPLLAWVERNAANLGIEDSKAKSVARAIQVSIAKRGIRAKWFMRDALPELQMILRTVLKTTMAGGK